MFLYAKVLVADLERKQRMSGVKQALHLPPIGLKNLFEEVIKNLTSTMTVEDISDLDHILMWVAHSGRLLTLKEIDSMLRCNSAIADDPVLDLEHKLRFQFGSLFELLREDGLSTSDLQSRLRENTILLETDQWSEMNDQTAFDMEACSTFDSNPSTTIVVFSHSSLLDFFTKHDGNINSHGLKIPIILATSIPKAQVAIFEQCFRLLRDSFLRPEQSLPALSVYAKNEWMAHALSCAAIIAYLGADQLAPLGTAVIELLTSRDLLEDPRGWLQSASISYWECKIAQKLLPLLNNRAVREDLSAETSNWLDNVSEEPITLFEPALQAIARQWLTHDFTRLKPKDCAIHLHVYRTRKLGLCVEDTNDDTLSPDAVEAAAEWAMLEKTLPWHWRVMECLCYLGHPEAALKHLEKFIDERSEWPPALCYMGRIFQKQQNFGVAMHYFSEAVTLAIGHQSLSHKLRGVTIKDAREGQAQCAEMQAVSCWPHDLISRAHMKHKAAKFYFMCYRTLRDDHYYCAKAIIHLGDVAWDFHLMPQLTIRSTTEIPLSYFSESCMFPSASACYKLIMEILGELQEDRLSCQRIGPLATKATRPRLLVCLAEYATPEDHFTRCIAFAAQRTGQLGWLVEQYRDAILLAEVSLQHMKVILLMNCLAVVLDDYVGSTEAALEVWKDVIERKAPADIRDWQMFKACQFAWDRLATAYTKVRLLPPERLKQDFGDSKTYLNPNIRWCRFLNVPELADHTMNDEECSMIMITEVLAQKASLNSRTGQALGLARFHAKIGDFKNATAAYSVYHEYLAGFAVTRTHRQSALTKVLLAGMSENSALESSNLAVCCDGPCRRTFIDWEGIITCCTCIDVDYCKDYFMLLETGELGMSSCTMEHHFWEVPILPNGTHFREGEVPVGDRILSVEEWAAELREKYCFSNDRSKDNDLRGDVSRSGS